MTWSRVVASGSIPRSNRGGRGGGKGEACGGRRGDGSRAAPATGAVVEVAGRRGIGVIPIQIKGGGAKESGGDRGEWVSG